MRNDMSEKIKQHYCQLGLYVKADIINDFNKLSYKVINDIKENSKTANDEKWNEWVEQSRKNKDIQEYIALNPYTPIKVLDGLISKGRIYQDTIINLATRKDLTVPLIEKMISKANEKTFKSIYFKFGNSEESINPKIINVITPIIVDNIIKHDSSLFNDCHLDIFNFTDNEDSISYLLNSDINLGEDILDRIANNKNLSADIRNKAFDMGCNFENIDSFTPYMAQKIYESAIESAIDDGTTSYEKCRIRKEAVDVLTKLADNKALNDSMMVDMSNRIFHPDLTPFTANGQLLINTIRKCGTYYMLVFMYGYANKLKDPISWKKFLLLNEKADDTLYKKVVNDAISDYFKKFNTPGIAYKSTDREANDLGFIANHLSDFDLGSTIYETLLDFLKTESQRTRQFNALKSSIACCVFIPEFSLKQVQDKEYRFDEKQKFLANLNLDMRKNKLKKYIKHITDAFRFDYDTYIYALENDTDLVKKIKAIVEQNIEKINDSTTQDKKLKEDFYKKLSIFDKKIESIKIQEETEKTKINTVSKYIQNLHKDCEVYAHLDDLIDAIEFDEKDKIKNTEKDSETKETEKEGCER